MNKISGFHHSQIDAQEKSILYSLDKYRILIVTANTGSGNSTRISMILFNAGIYNQNTSDETYKHKMICVTQPRRASVVQLSKKVAIFLKCDIGTTVGYAIEHNDTSNLNHTQIKFMTEDLLMKELLTDPLLNRYSVIIVDEAHERNLETDLLLGCLKCLMLKRTDLKLVICLTTFDSKSFAEFFNYEANNFQVMDSLKRPYNISIESEIFPVKVFYLQEPVANFMDAAVETVINIHETTRLASGKILLFLTGSEEIDYVCDKLTEYADRARFRSDLRVLKVLPLHASLKPDEISRVFDEYEASLRVCIVSTNIAESSLTVNGVKFVVDCGFVKVNYYDSDTGVNCLVRVPTSQQTALQRASRAGRSSGGSVYRLYTESFYEQLRCVMIPEIQRSSLSSAVLRLMSLGVDDLRVFPLLSPLPKRNLSIALDELYALGAIDDSGSLTKTGELMCRLNLDPQLSKVLLGQRAECCTLEVCHIAAMLQVKDVFLKPKGRFSDLWTNTDLTDICASEGDIPSYLNIFNEFIRKQKSRKWTEKLSLNYRSLMDAVDISHILQKRLRDLGIKIQSSNGRIESIQRAFVEGYFSNAAYLHPSGEYRTVRSDKQVKIHPMSVLNGVLDRPKFVIFKECISTDSIYMLHIVSVEQSWLLDTTSNFYILKTNLSRV